MKRHLIETVMGAAVLLVAGAFVTFAYQATQQRLTNGYQLKAAFFKTGGLVEGSDVRISGIKVGTVIDNRLDQETFDAIVTLSIRQDVKIPADTVAGIGSEGIMGGKYLRLKPGRASRALASGEQISRTEDFKSLEDQVGEIIFLATTPGGSADGPR